MLHIIRLTNIFVLVGKILQTIKLGKLNIKIINELKVLIYFLLKNFIFIKYL